MALELGISRLVWLVSGGPGRTSDRWLSGRPSEERLDLWTVCRARAWFGFGLSKSASSLNKQSRTVTNQGNPTS